MECLLSSDVHLPIDCLQYRLGIGTSLDNGTANGRCLRNRRCGINPKARRQYLSAVSGLPALTRCVTGKHVRRGPRRNGELAQRRPDGERRPHHAALHIPRDERRPRRRRHSHRLQRSSPPVKSKRERDRIFHFASPKDRLVEGSDPCRKHSSRSAQQVNERARCQSMQIRYRITDS